MKNFLSFALVIFRNLHRGFHIKNKIHASSAIVDNVDDDEDSDRNDIESDNIDIDGRLCYTIIYAYQPAMPSNRMQKNILKFCHKQETSAHTHSHIHIYASYCKQSVNKFNMRDMMHCYHIFCRKYFSFAFNNTI